MRVVPLLLVVVAACWRSTPAAEPIEVKEREPEPTYARYHQPPAPSRCDSVIGHLLDVFRSELASAGFKDDVVGRLEIAAATSCSEMRWSDELLDCFAGVATTDTFAKCQAQMSSLQIDDLQKRMVEVMSNGTTP